ncbi:MAG: hypothetical protein JWL97_3824 [Gemmatimonadales bacterium]|nr:hypothetical protein [Gemmatimonadales bacterium]
MMLPLLVQARPGASNVRNKTRSACAAQMARWWNLHAGSSPVDCTLKEGRHE